MLKPLVSPSSFSQIFFRSFCSWPLSSRIGGDLAGAWSLARLWSLWVALDGGNTVDYLGVNYYQPLRVAAPRYAPNPASPLLLSNFMNPMSCQVARLIPTVVGEIYEQACMTLPKISRKTMAISEWILTENGMGGRRRGKKFRENGVIQDDYRIDFVKDHLRELHRLFKMVPIVKAIWSGPLLTAGLGSMATRTAMAWLNWISKVKKTPLKKSGHWFQNWASRMDLKSRKSNLSTKMLIGFFLTTSLTRPIFLYFLVDKLEKALYTDSNGYFFW